MAHAGKLRVIAESTRKTDKVDAFVLVEFLAKDMIPEAWRPTPRVRQHRSLLDENTARLKKLDGRLKEFAATAPVREAEARAVLATMPGVGPVTIETVLAELGDWRRFHSADAVVSFAGLDPGVRESGHHESAARRKDMRLTKAGSPLLRWIMIQLAHRMKRTTARWRKLFEQISRRAGKKKATCAIARRLLLVIYAMLRDGQAYQMAGAA